MYRKFLSRFLLLAVSLAIASCQAGQGSIASPAAETLVGPLWQWVSFSDPLQSFEVANPENYTVQFNADGTMAVQADCNRGVWQFQLDGQSITITPGQLTEMACPAGSQGDQFRQYLGNAAVYYFRDGELFIDQKFDSGTLRFRQ